MATGIFDFMSQTRQIKTKDKLKSFCNHWTLISRVLMYAYVKRFTLRTVIRIPGPVWYVDTDMQRKLEDINLAFDMYL